MANGVPKKQKLAEQRRKKRVEVAPARVAAAKTPPAKRQLPAAHYPTKRAALGKRQAPAIDGGKSA